MLITISLLACALAEDSHHLCHRNPCPLDAIRTHTAKEWRDTIGSTVAANSLIGYYSTSVYPSYAIGSLPDT